jgi:hypothetical protein
MEETCLVWTDDGYKEMPLTEAKGKNLPVILCQYKICKHPAVILDPKWPFYWDANRCVNHLEN